MFFDLHIGVFIGICFGIGLFIGYLIGYLIGRIKKYREVARERKQAISQSKSVILGEVYEKVIPILQDFPYHPRDMVFIGKGFDYLIIRGLSAGYVEEIIFLEVKSGSARLNKNEKLIRDAIQNKRVRFEEYRIKS